MVVDLALMPFGRSRWYLGVAFILCVVLTTVVSAQTYVEFSQQEIAAISAQGPWQDSVPPDPGNELSGLAWAEGLGENLFFDAKLSVNGSVSCATCHQPELGFADDQPLAIGLKQGVRNTQGLLDVGMHRWFGWGGGTDSLWAASIRPLLDANEMGNNVASLANKLRADKQVMLAIQKNLLADETIADLDKLSLTEIAAIAEASDTELSDAHIVAFSAKTIGAYMRTIRSSPTVFDRFREALINKDLKAQQAYSESAKRGLKIFIGEANCRVCHFGPNFSNGEFHDTGRPFFTDVGQVDSGRYAGIQRVRADQFNLQGKYSDASDTLKTSSVKLGQVNWGQWRTPSLRNLKLTAPYMHDGSLATLRDVVDAYADIDVERLHTKGESILKPLNLDDGQRNDLVNFLQSLSAEN